MYAKIYTMDAAIAKLGMQPVVSQIKDLALTDRDIVKLNEHGSGKAVYLCVSSTYEGIKQIGEDIAIAVGDRCMTTVEALALDADRIEATMIEEAVPKMTAFFGDIAYDLQSVRELTIEQTAYWYVRKTGTKAIIGDYDMFADDMEALGTRVVAAYRIYRYDKSTFIISKYK